MFPSPHSYTVKTMCIRTLTLRRIGGGDSDDVINNNDITFCDDPGSVILTADASIFLGTTPGRRKKRIDITVVVILVVVSFFRK